MCSAPGCTDGQWQHHPHSGVPWCLQHCSCRHCPEASHFPPAPPVPCGQSDYREPISCLRPVRRHLTAPHRQQVDWQVGSLCCVLAIHSQRAHQQAGFLTASPRSVGLFCAGFLHLVDSRVHSRWSLPATLAMTPAGSAWPARAPLISVPALCPHSTSRAPPTCLWLVAASPCSKW